MAFNMLCNTLCYHVILYVPKLDDNFTVFTDASSKEVGSVLCVYRDGVKYPVAFNGSRTALHSKRIESFSCSFNNKTLGTLFVGKTVYCNN